MSLTTRRDFMKTAALAPLALPPLRLAQAGPAASRAEVFDYVVAGAGHNSLICAAYLAKAGNRVLVLEGRAMIGGGAKTAELLPPGFKQDLCSSSHPILPPTRFCPTTNSICATTATRPSIRKWSFISRFWTALLSRCS